MKTIVDLLGDIAYNHEVDKAIMPIVIKYGIDTSILKIFSDAFAKGYVAGFNNSTKEHERRL